MKLTLGVSIFALTFVTSIISLQLVGPTLNLVPLNRRILESKFTQKCLTVQGDDFKLVLDSCNWDKGRSDIESVFSIIKSSPGGHLIRWSTAPKYNGIEGCLTLKGDEPLRDDSTDDEVFLAKCDPKSTVQNWMFQQANDKQEGEYIVTKYGEGKCLSIPTDDSDSSASVLKTAPCNPEDTEQIWRICEDFPDLHKCDK